jgi:Bacterial Ig-like domain/Chitobiase/beta-hexosaminidase C-terminal domain
VRGESRRWLVGTAAFALTLALAVAAEKTADASSYTIVPGGPPVVVTTTAANENATATFAGTAGHSISLSISGVTISSAFVSILKPDSTVLVAATSFTTAGKFIDRTALPVTGTYTILIDPQGTAVGSATLRLYDVPADVPATITPGGAAVTVTTTVPGQNAKVTFTGALSQRVSLKIGPTCCATKVSILKPDNTALVAATSFTTAGGFIDTKTLPVAGTYTIVVDPQSSVVGATTLTLYNVPADVTTPITPGGAAVTMTLGTPGQNGKLTFTGVAGRGIAINMSGVTIGTSTSSSYKLSVVKPDATNLLAPTLYGTNGGFIDTMKLPVAGTYSIVVDPQSSATGAITVQLYDVPPDLTGTITPGGAPVSLTFTAPYQNGRVTFAGTAGERISLKIAFAPTACCTVNVSILNPSGSRLVAPVGVASGEGLIDSTTLPVTGTYTILVDPYQTAMGTVTLTLYDLPPDITASATLDGPAITVTTVTAGQNARVTFTGAANDGVIVKLGPGNCCNVSVSVLKPDSTTLVAPTMIASTGGSVYMRLPVAGTYTIVLDYFGASVGSVTLQLIRDSTAPTAPALTLTSSTTDGFVQGGTFFYRPAGTGTVQVAAATTDAGSGVNKVVFPGLSGGFTPTAATSDVSSPYVVVYSWSGSGTFNNSANTVTAYDFVGNTSSSTFAVIPDSTAPTTTDNTAPIGNAWKNTNQTVILTPSDGTGSGVAATYHTTDGSTPTTSSPTGTSFTLSADGQYTIKYFSVDNVTNAEAVKTAGTVIRIDKTPPTVTMTAPPANIRNGQVLTATASDALSGIASVAYYYCAGTSCTPSTLIGTSTTGPNYSVTWSSMPADGPYQLLARATDVAGNTTDSAKRNVTIDNTPPAAPTITAKPPNPSNATAPSFSFTGEAGATFQCQLDGGAFSACTSPKAYSGLAAGSHTFNVRQTDTAGNTGPNASYTWTIDTTPPAAPSISANPPALSNSTSASFSFTGEAGATFGCALDGSAFTVCTSPKNYTALADGSHTFQVRQTDTAGNTGPNASYTWTVDATPPAAPTITVHPTNPSNSTSASFSFTGEAGATFACQLDGGGFSACTSPKAYSGLAEGSHTFNVRQTDTAGNTSPSATFTWTIDTTAPAAPSITANPPNPTNSTAASFSFTGEAGATFQCQLDGGGFSACTSPKAYSGLAAGSHTFQVRQTDTAGNTGPAASYTWTIDTTPPAAPTISAHPADPTNSTSASFSFSGEAGATFECQLDGGAFTGCSSPRAYSSLAQGSHTFHVRQTDTAGNTGSNATFTWAIDTTAPDTSIDSSPTDPSSPDVSFAFSANEGGSTFECSLDGAAFSACTSPQAYNGLASGSHTFDVRATDAAGNTDPTPATFSWTVT